MQSLKRFSSNFYDKESKIQTKINQKDLKNPDKTVAKHSSFNPFRKLGSFTLFCLKKFGILKEKKCESSSQVEPEIQNESEVENEDLSHKVLIGIEVYMPIVDVENNTLIPPKFDRPIFKYRDIDNDKQPLKTSDMANEKSRVNRTKKSSKFATVIKNEQLLKTNMINENSNFNTIKKKSNYASIIKEKQPVKTPDMANENSDLHISKKTSKFATAIKDEQPFKTSDMADENSNFNRIKEESKFAIVIKEKQPVKTSDMANENLDLHISKKESKFDMIIKNVEKSISRVSQLIKPFKNKRRNSENQVIPPEIKMSSKMEQSNIAISKENNKYRSPTSVNSLKSKFLALKSPSNENETKSKQEVNNLKQNDDLMNPRNTSLRLKGPMDIESNVKSTISIKPITMKKKCRISSTSSTSDTSSQLSSSQPFELCTLLTDTNSITRNQKYKNETFEAKNYETIHKHEEPKVNEIDLANVQDTNGEAEIYNKELMHEFHHPKSSQIMEKAGKVRLPYSKAEIRSKLSKSLHRFLEENASRIHLPMQVNTDYYIDETPMSNSCRQLPTKQYFLQKREMSHFSLSTTTQIDGSRTTFRDGKERRQKRTARNPSFTVAGHRRLLQLMKSDV